MLGSIINDMVPDLNELPFQCRCYTCKYICTVALEERYVVGSQGRMVNYAWRDGVWIMPHVD